MRFLRPLTTLFILCLANIAWAAEGGTATRPTGTTALPRVFILNPLSLLAARKAVAEREPSLQSAVDRLRDDAEQAMKVEPVSVMDKTTVPPSGDKHDYMSQGSYWWPNPKTKDGLPYVRRDGEHNPECSKFDSKPMHRVCEATESLALAWYLLGEERYAAHAATLLRTWFLDPATRMKPNLKYGQAIPGVCRGRAIGIIDTAVLARLVDSIGLLGGSHAWTAADQTGMKAWFGAYLHWLLESDLGQEEARQPNNHGTYYDVQVAALALFVDEKKLARPTLGRSAQRRIAAQIEPDGRQPYELARTQAWGYSVANVTGLVQLARLAAHYDVDLWHLQTADGRGIRKAIDWLARYADGKTAFPYKQITRMDYGRFAWVLKCAAMAYHEPRYDSLLPRLSGFDLDQSRLRLTEPR